MFYIHFIQGLSLKGFCCWYIWATKQTDSVLSMAPFGLQHSFNPSRHALNQVLTHCSVNLVPLFLHPLPQLQYSSSCFFILSKPPLEVIPQMFNRIEVWGLCWP